MNTGLSVPECSCSRCLEAMLRSFRPELIGDEIRVRRTTGERGKRGSIQPEQRG